MPEPTLEELMARLTEQVIGLSEVVDKMESKERDTSQTGTNSDSQGGGSGTDTRTANEGHSAEGLTSQRSNNTTQEEKARSAK